MNTTFSSVTDKQRYRPIAPSLPTLKSTLDYLKKPVSTNLHEYMYEPDERTRSGRVEYESHIVEIADARVMSSQTSIHSQGFELWDAPSVITDFRDWDAITKTYYQEMSELACMVTGAKEAYVFDHLVRKREEDRRPLTFGRTGDGSKPAPAGRVHNDYTESSGLKWLREVIKDVDKLIAVRRFSIVNIWRSINGPALDSPLAICDARTVSANDLAHCNIHYPDRTGAIYLSMPASEHAWYYYSAMDRHEVLVFKQYDTQLSGVARFTPHAAFEHPETPEDWPLRESIELRCLVIYE